MQTRREVDPLLSPDALHARVPDYTAGQDAALGLISPIFADLSGLPPDHPGRNSRGSPRRRRPARATSRHRRRRGHPRHHAGGAPRLPGLSPDPRRSGRGAGQSRPAPVGASRRRRTRHRISAARHDRASRRVRRIRGTRPATMRRSRSHGPVALEHEGAGDAHQQDDDVRPQALALLDAGRVQRACSDIVEESQQRKGRHHIERAVERERGRQVTLGWPGRTPGRAARRPRGAPGACGRPAGCRSSSRRASPGGARPSSWPPRRTRSRTPGSRATGRPGRGAAASRSGSSRGWQPQVERRSVIAMAKMPSDNASRRPSELSDAGPLGLVALGDRRLLPAHRGSTPGVPDVAGDVEERGTQRLNRPRMGLRRAHPAQHDRRRRVGQD